MVGTAFGGVLVFSTQDLIGETYSCVEGFAAAAATTPLTCLSLGCLPIQRIELFCYSGNTETRADQKRVPASPADITAHLLAVQADGTVCEEMVHPGLLQTSLSRSLLHDRKMHSQAAGDACRVLPANTAPVSTLLGSGGLNNSPVLTTAHVDGGPLAVAILGAPGVLQLWLLAEGTEQQRLSTEWTTPPTSLNLKFSW